MPVTFTLDTASVSLIVAIVAAIIAIAVPVIGYILKRIETRGVITNRIDTLVRDVEELKKTVNNLREKTAGMTTLYNIISTRLLALDEWAKLGEGKK
jgi:uncharacterized protein YoxC